MAYLDLAARFQGQVAGWKGDGPGFRQILETANEVCVATMILASKGVVELEYEPALLKTKKSFDFRVTLLLGKKRWIDVKSVGPAWQDDDAGWERYEAISDNFQGNARLIVDRGFGGAAISGQEFKARWAMAARAKEVEEKITLLTDAEKAPVKNCFFVQTDRYGAMPSKISLISTELECFMRAIGGGTSCLDTSTASRISTCVGKPATSSNSSSMSSTHSRWKQIAIIEPVTKQKRTQCRRFSAGMPM